MKAPEQLPEITAPDFVLVWDAEEGDSIIKHQEQIVFVEPIIFEGYERYKTVIDILKARYGNALKGVHPTPSAYETMCGDKLWSGSRMKQNHAETFGYEFK